MTPELEGPPVDHYFSEHPRAPSSRRELRFLYRGEILVFAVDAGVFASRGLDPGTALLIEHLAIADGDQVLDLGCGWGAVGVAAAKATPRGRVVLTDVNRRAARLARVNAERNHLGNVEVRVGTRFAPVGEERFDVVAANPPFHVGRGEILEMLAEVPAHLTARGRLLLVGKGSQGIRFYQEWLVRHWSPGVTVVGRGSGYRVLEARVAGDAGRPAGEALKKGGPLGGRPPDGRADRRASPRRRTVPRRESRTGE